jgi:hypothetical protein
MKNIHEYLKVGTDQSIMRFEFHRSNQTARVIGILAISGAVAGLIIGIIFGRDLTMLSAVIGALLGGATGLIAAFLIPSYSGKAAQSKFEQENKGGNL